MAIAVDGQLIAQAIIAELEERIVQLMKRNIIPWLAVILVGKDAASLVYIRQKQKIATKLLAKFLLCQLAKNTSLDKLQQVIDIYNKDTRIHGVIVQLPLPAKLNPALVAGIIKPEKDIDGLSQQSPFTPPVAAAVLKILEHIYKAVRQARQGDRPKQNQGHGSPEVGELKITTLYKGAFLHWLRKKTITVLGRGQTAGKPIAQKLKKLGCKLNIIHSQTKNPKNILAAADIIVSCVGKRGVVKARNIKKGAILIGVGLHQENGRLVGDYDEAEIAKKASFYTPTPGGVGPVNVACLWKNVVRATQQKKPLNL